MSVRELVYARCIFPHAGPGALPALAETFARRAIAHADEEQAPLKARIRELEDEVWLLHHHQWRQW